MLTLGCHPHTRVSSAAGLRGIRIAGGIAVVEVNQSHVNTALVGQAGVFGKMFADARVRDLIQLTARQFRIGIKRAIQPGDVNTRDPIGQPSFPIIDIGKPEDCLLYTSPSPRD